MMTIKEPVTIRMDAFENPDKKPINEVKLTYISDGIAGGELISALDHRWCNKGYVFTLYTSPPATDVNGEFTMGSKEDWIERVSLLIADMNMLLHMRYHRFWSELIYNKHSLDGVNSFLQNAAPFFMKDQMPHNKEIFRMFKKVQELVLLVLIRLTNPKESEDCWMKNTTLASILYNNFLLSMPQLMEICLIYAHDNFNVVEDLINRVLTIQPKYLNDVEKSASFICEVFSKFENHLNTAVDLDHGASIIESCKESLSSNEIVKLTYLLLDVSYSLAAFLEVCPQAAIKFHNQQLELRIASFYGNTVPVLNRLLETQYKSEGSSYDKSTLQLKINLSRHQLVSSAHSCLTSLLLGLIENREFLAEEEIKNNVDSYINVLYECLSEHLFIKDYNSAFPVQKELKILAEICMEIDSLKCEYIVESIMSFYELPKGNPKKETTAIALEEIELTNNVNNHVQKPKENNKKISGVELDSLITEVRDILPHLGDGFVAKCLEHFNFVSADVINSVLENNLPESLTSIDPEMPLIPAEVIEENNDSYERNNVYDNDEFDIMTQDNIDTSRVHKGKRQTKHKNLSEMLDDKSHVNQLRYVYNQLSLVQCFENVNEYEDEYDDSYDDIDVPAGNEGEKEEERRAFVTPRVLQQYKKTVNNDLDYKGEDYEEDEENDTRQRDLFIENPADIRERAEQRRLDMRGRGSGRSRAAFSNRNVIGNPKGQVQEKDVVRNREHKNTNKAFRGNHNRRAMADKKRRQGMFPS